MKNSAIVINEKDNVATALRDIKANDTVSLSNGGSLKAAENISFGHKIAVTKIIKTEPIIKYGENIGRATTDINAGSWVHVHNVDSCRGRGDLAAENEGAR